MHGSGLQLKLVEKLKFRKGSCFLVLCSLKVQRFLNWSGHRLLFLLMNRADTNSNNPLKYMLGNSTFVIHVY